MAIRENENKYNEPSTPDTYIKSLSDISGIEPGYIQALDNDTLAMLEMSLSTFIEDSDIKHEILSAVMYAQKKISLPKLSEKIQNEYDTYLDELRHGSVENAISNAYQITAKQDILAYMQSGDVRLLPEQYNNLLSSLNALEEVYNELCSSDSNDIGHCLEVAANKIGIANKRQQEKSNIEKLNPDFYKSLSRADRYIKQLPDDIADKTISQLRSAGIEFSAVRRAKDVTAITVHKNNAERLNNIADQAVSEKVNEQIVSKNDIPQYGQPINPDFYKSLPKEDRFVTVYPLDKAQKYMTELLQAGCKFSATARKGSHVAITIDKKDGKSMNVFQRQEHSKKQFTVGRNKINQNAKNAQKRESNKNNVKNKNVSL